MAWNKIATFSPQEQALVPMSLDVYIRDTVTLTQAAQGIADYGVQFTKIAEHPTSETGGWYDYTEWSIAFAVQLRRGWRFSYHHSSSVNPWLDGCYYISPYYDPEPGSLAQTTFFPKIDGGQTYYPSGYSTTEVVNSTPAVAGLYLTLIPPTGTGQLLYDSEQNGQLLYDPESGLLIYDG